MKKHLLALAFCATTVTGACAETWVVVDGSPRNLTNVWDIVLDKDQITASAGVIDPTSGADANARMSFPGVVVNGQYRISMPVSPTGPVCLFIGSPETPDLLVGVANCGGRNAIWRAQRL